MLTSLVEMDRAAMMLKLLGDKTRLTMVKLLSTNDFCVCEFVEIFKISQPAVSQHIRKLKDAGLVSESRKGQWVFYSINKECDTYPFIQSLLEHLPDQDYRMTQLEKQGLRISCQE
ncbi:metalloregulator ArsR/SmtB family transcription factor (plasmid) [Cytobacillus spongiae]|uniref:ArsR/SmtB family transcription factor n=1 Tax=Cytobacillus spongiae TaxID=2901381 RepID=UPI001CD5B2CB|nr:metalloregulator ArsR/SmtB family transcription factor [Cytobacillus spongiae]MCA1062572.1 metalloregulator ArsR/SmtB family transcription factor [Rossellomorea aquimaris]UII58213.1 metalloregulator ArsR/SmtB family transcription factor [Cytobacillus spongiae]WJV28751.1 metalloregulator ArsR/SmtB family transcription factor [Rossellomorea sp. AcN35-11]